MSPCRERPQPKYWPSLQGGAIALSAAGNGGLAGTAGAAATAAAEAAAAGVAGLAPDLTSGWDSAFAPDLAAPGCVSGVAAAWTGAAATEPPWSAGSLA